MDLPGLNRRKWLVPAGAAFVLLAALVALAVGRSHGVSPVDHGAYDYDKVVRDMERDRQPVATLSLDDLLTHYRANEVEAAQKYGCLRAIEVVTTGCRVIETSAEIEDIGRERDSSYLVLATKTPYIPNINPASNVSIKARFPDLGGSLPATQPSLVGLRRGQRVTVRCSPLYEDGALTLVNCVAVR